ncbi:glycosyltransferase family 4 protein [Candidatus Woesearchaeota archaeon]|nr:glycosyltransferase family 4 protein [Candidatus Woesearchaeota archaeon]
MNVLVFSEYFPSHNQGITGGVESRAFHLLRETAKKHHVTVICSYQDRQPRIDRVDGVTVLRVGPKSPYANTGNILRRLGYVSAAFATGVLLPKIDVVEGWTYLNYPLAWLVGRIKGKPVVQTYHESWTFTEWLRKGWITGMFGWLWARFSLAALPATRYIAVSNATKERLVEQGIRSRKIDVVYNGVDATTFRSIKVRPLRQPSVSTTARLIKTKRVDVLIKAIALLKKEYPDIILTINGEGEEEPRLRQLVAQLRLERNVVFKGRIGRFEDVLRLRKRHQVFCLPSEVEGFGMVVVEAMALGVPVVCTDIPVLREVAGKSASLFKPGDADDLAEKLGALLADARLRQRKSKEAFRHAQSFDWKKIALRADAVYRSVSSAKK